MAKPDRKPARRSKPRPEDLTPQVGRRPSPPALLFVVAAMWITTGIVAIVALSASWKLVPGIVFIGIGLMYLRGALTTVARRSDG
jgi:hypothetical protein